LTLDAHLTKSFPDFRLDVRLSCDPGLTVLFGSSGAGKTLTLHSIAGLVRPDAGRILLGGEILFDAQRRVHLSARERGVGYVFQNDAVFPHMTVEENLLFPLSRAGPLERRRRCRSLLETFRLAQFASRYPRGLSGGERQRVAIARALAAEPRLLLLDEPARGLDHELRMDLYWVLREVLAQYRIPILLVTHDRDESFRLGQRLVIYRGGRIVQDGSAEEVFSAPKDAGVAQLLGYGNVFPATIERLDPAAGTSRLRAGDLSLTTAYLPGRLLGDRVEFCVPPHRVRIGPGENQFEAEFASEARLPSTVRLFFRAGGVGELECEVSRDSHDSLSIPSSRRLTLSVPRAAIHVFQKNSGD
jgi:molybdate transport system ATP-binding protein